MNIPSDNWLNRGNPLDDDEGPELSAKANELYAKLTAENKRKFRQNVERVCKLDDDYTVDGYVEKLYQDQQENEDIL